MNPKKIRQQKAMKKAAQTKKIVIIICVFVVAAIIAAVAFEAIGARNRRVYANSGGTVTLQNNGKFVASLSHDAVISGTYSEETTDDVTTVLFTHQGRTDTGSINDTVLTVPNAWLSTCSHTYSPEFTLRK